MKDLVAKPRRFRISMDAQWMPSGCPVDAQWMPSGCPAPVDAGCEPKLLDIGQFDDV